MQILQYIERPGGDKLAQVPCYIRLERWPGIPKAQKLLIRDRRLPGTDPARVGTLRPQRSRPAVPLLIDGVQIPQPSDVVSATTSSSDHGPEPRSNHGTSDNRPTQDCQDAVNSSLRCPGSTQTDLHEVTYQPGRVRRSYRFISRLGQGALDEGQSCA